MRKIAAMMVSAVLILAAGCAKKTNSLTQEELKTERKNYIEDVDDVLKQVEQMDWYKDDLKLVAVTPMYPIDADGLSTAEVKSTYSGPEYNGDVYITGRKDMKLYFVDDDENYYYCRVKADGIILVKDRTGKITDQVRENMFYVSKLLESSCEEIDKARQQGDLIIQGGDPNKDTMTFFIDAAEIA